MTNSQKYENAFTETFKISVEEAKNLKYQDIKDWDSVGHMELIAVLEESFDIAMETDDIVDLSSFQKGKEILSTNYGVKFDD